MIHSAKTEAFGARPVHGYVPVRIDFSLVVAINALQTRFQDRGGRSITASIQTRQNASNRQQTGFYSALKCLKCHVAVGVEGHAARKNSRSFDKRGLIELYCVV